jgi:hypothetical protein
MTIVPQGGLLAFLGEGHEFLGECSHLSLGNANSSPMRAIIYPQGITIVPWGRFLAISLGNDNNSLKRAIISHWRMLGVHQGRLSQEGK